MNELYDMCCSIRNHSIKFTLNPGDCWSNFDSNVKELVYKQEWQEIKFLNDTADQINEEISQVPNNMGGIYMFVLHPNLVPDMHRYILYVGRVLSTETQNLRKRFREYVKDTRTDIMYMRETWGKDLYIRYLPLTDNELIKQLERELMTAILPPCNTQYEGKLTSAMAAAGL